MFGTAKKSDDSNKNRVGYVAFLGTNYGSVLQALALRIAVNRMGYDCQLLCSDYFTDAPKPGKTLKASKPKRYDYRIMRWLFASFIRRNFSMSKTLGHIGVPLTEEQKREMSGFDAFICGSDQIWNPSSFWFVPSNYLEFAPKGKRIAYAPSVGMKDIPEKLHQNLRLWFERLREIDFLSAREKVSSRMIERITGRKVATVLDPTLLVTPEEWLKLLSRPVWPKEVGSTVKSGRKYVLAYLLDLEPLYREKITGFAAAKGLELVWLAGRDDRGPLTVNCSQTDPSGFVHLLAGAEYVFVDGYHGTCFSINFRKPFAVLRATSEEKRNLDMRIANLFETLGIAGADSGVACALSPEDEISDSSFFRDFNSIVSCLDSARRGSLEYLADSLRGASDSCSRKLPPAYELGYRLSSELSDPERESGTAGGNNVNPEHNADATADEADVSGMTDDNGNRTGQPKVSASASGPATGTGTVFESFPSVEGFAEFPLADNAAVRADGDSAKIGKAANSGDSPETGNGIEGETKTECAAKITETRGSAPKMYAFSFEQDVWEIMSGSGSEATARSGGKDDTAISDANGSTVLKTRLATPGKGHFAFVESPLPLQRNHVYTVDVVFRYRTASGLINFHLYNPDSGKVQIVHGYRTQKPTKELSPAKNWKHLRFSFIPNSSGYTSFMVGAYHLSGKKAFIEFGRLSIMAAT